MPDMPGIVDMVTVDGMGVLIKRRVGDAAVEEFRWLHIEQIRSLRDPKVDE